jgi:hypothetical protein
MSAKAITPEVAVKIAILVLSTAGMVAAYIPTGNNTVYFGWLAILAVVMWS